MAFSTCACKCGLAIKEIPSANDATNNASFNNFSELLDTYLGWYESEEPLYSEEFSIEESHRITNKSYSIQQLSKTYDNLKLVVYLH